MRMPSRNFKVRLLLISSAQIFLFYFCPIQLSRAGDNPTASEIVRNVQDKYKQIDDAVIKFTQTVVLPLSKIVKTTEGTLYLKKGNKYRIESENRIVVTDGKTSWFYLAGPKQVVIDNYRDDKNTVNPDRFLLDVPTDYFAVLLATQKSDKDTTYILRLTPKSDDSFIRAIKISIDGSWTVRRAEVSDMNDTKSTYTVDDLKINTGLSDSDFKFIPPKDAQVVDMRSR